MIKYCITTNNGLSCYIYLNKTSANLDILTYLPDDIKLTYRDKCIIRLLQQNKSIDQMAKELYQETSQIKNYINHIYKKLKVKSNQELFSFLEDCNSEKNIIKNIAKVLQGENKQSPDIYKYAKNT